MSWATALAGLNSSNINTFGESFTFTPALTGTPASKTGIAHEPSLEEEAAPGNVLVLFVRSSDFSVAPVRGDGVTYNSTSYKVSDVRSDGGGGLDLYLRKA